MAVYDDKESRIIVYVGSKFDEAIASDIGQIRPVGETWAYDVEADTWEDMQAVDTPVGLLASSIAFDSESGQVILYGGADLTREKNGIVPLSDATWSYNLADNVWTQMSPKDPPPARALAAMTYDVGVDRVVLFGGHKAAFTKPFAGELAGGVSLADTWEYDFNDDAWSPMEPAMAPEARRCGSMVYDSFLGRSILVGGSDGLDCSGSFRDSWAFDAMTSTWTRLGEAPQLTFQGMAYIPETNEIVAYVGGTAWIYFKPAFWAYNLDENEWREVEAGK